MGIKKEEKIKIASGMLKKGMSVKEVYEITGLTKRTVETLSKEV